MDDELSEERRRDIEWVRNLLRSQTLEREVLLKAQAFIHAPYYNVQGAQDELSDAVRAYEDFVTQSEGT